MMRNLVRILLISSALVAAPVSSAYAAISPATVALGGSATASAAITTAYAALQAALATGDSVAAAAAITALRAALPANVDVGGLLNAMLEDLVRDAAAANVSVANLAGVLSGVVTAAPEGAIDAGAITTAAVAAGYPADANLGIGAVAGAGGAAAPGGLTIIDNGAPGGGGGATAGAGTPVSPT